MQTSNKIYIKLEFDSIDELLDFKSELSTLMAGTVGVNNKDFPIMDEIDTKMFNAIEKMNDALGAYLG